jgi:hypothetical protein
VGGDSRRRDVAARRRWAFAVPRRRDRERAAVGATLNAAAAAPAVRRGRPSVRPTPQARALLGDWLLRRVLPIWLDGAGLERRPWVAGDRPWESVVKDVLGGWVQATAWRCRSAFGRSSVGAHAYLALQHSVVAAERDLDGSSLAVLQWTTRQRFVELTAAMSAPRTVS